jgi:hypothetical protein
METQTNLLSENYYKVNLENFKFVESQFGGA